MELFRSSLGEISLISEVERAASSQHRVNQHEGATIEVRRSNVFHADFDVVLATFLAVGTHKCAVCIGEYFQEAFVEGKTSAQYSADDDAIVDGAHLGRSKGSLERLVRIIERFRHFIRHGVTNATEVLTEPSAILLYIDVAQFSKIVVDDSVLFGEVNDFHI